MDERATFDEFTRLRLRRAGLVEPDRELLGGGTPAFVGQVVSPASMIGAGKFLMVRPVSVLGPEAEGGAGNLTPWAGDPVAVYLVGPGTPSTGEYLVCRFVDHRWAAERPRGGSATDATGTIPNCACTSIPASLSMVSADPACNYRMFQSCSIEYGPTPPEFASLNLGPNIFRSTQSFPDPAAANAKFIYFLTCRRNLISLTRLYATSPYGSPFRDAALYTWAIGNIINICSPFRMTNGQPFPGSDGSCFVTITG